MAGALPSLTGHRIGVYFDINVNYWRNPGDRMGQAHLLRHEEGGVLWLTLNRPARLNALDVALVTELRALFQGLRQRPDIRVVMIRGAGRGFCAGLDLQASPEDLDTRPVEALLDAQRDIAEIVIAMRRAPQPIIALVQGPASGGGFAIALGADVRLATPEAKFNASFIKLGLSACDIGVSYFLPRMVGASVAAELMLTGDMIGADRAERLGLVSRVVPAAELEGEGRALAARMLAATPLGLRLTKEALTHAIDAPSLEAAVAMEDRNQILCVKDDAFRGRIEAFLAARGRG